MKEQKEKKDKILQPDVSQKNKHQKLQGSFQSLPL